MDDYRYLEVLVRNCIKTNNKNSKECKLFHSEFKKVFSVNNNNKEKKNIYYK
jgi:hypothetical protein